MQQSPIPVVDYGTAPKRREPRILPYIVFAIFAAIAAWVSPGALRGAGGECVLFVFFGLASVVVPFLLQRDLH